MTDGSVKRFNAVKLHTRRFNKYTRPLKDCKLLCSKFTLNKKKQFRAIRGYNPDWKGYSNYLLRGSILSLLMKCLQTLNAFINVCFLPPLDPLPSLLKRADIKAF